MKELDELREWVTYAATLGEYTPCYTLAKLDAIEQAIADRYMELPVDADGVPIRVGDDLGVGTALYVSDDGVCIGGNSCGFWEATSLRHAKPDTIEDVLADFAVKFEERDMELAYLRGWEDARRGLKPDYRSVVS